MPQPKILVAEDEGIVAFDLCDTVKEAGYSVLGPHSNISSAMLSFQKEKPDLAILDVQLHDGVVFPLARMLEEEDIPIIFHSVAAAREEVKQRFPKARALAKPCPPARMIDTVTKALYTH